MIDSPQGNAAATLARTKRIEIQHFADGGSVRRTTVKNFAKPSSAAAAMAQMPPSHAGAKPMEHGGAVHGPGGPTADAVPIWASDGEFMLPADTTAAVGKDKLEALVDATHKPTNKAREKMGRMARADGGEIDPGAVTRVGNSYSGGNVSGSITVNGQAPGGTFSTGSTATPASAATQLAAPAPLPSPAPVATPTPAPVAPAVRAAPVTNRGGAQTQLAAFADGGLIDDPRKRPNSFGDAAAVSSDPNVAQVTVQAPAVPAANPMATPPAAAGQPGASQIPASPGSLSPPPPAAPAPVAAPAYTQAIGGAADAARNILATAPTAAATAVPVAPAPGAVNRQGNSFTGTNVSGDVSINGAPASGSVGTVSAPGVTGADRLGQLNRDIAFEKDKQTWRNPGDPAPGLAVIDDAAAQAQAHAQRANFGVTSGQRARLQMATLRDTGDTQRALIQEQGVDARTRAQTAFQQQQLGLEGKKVALDASREDRAATASTADQAQKARLAQLQEQVVNGSPQERRRATEQLAALQGREIVGNHPPAGYERTADGNLKFIKGGPADPDTPKGKGNLTDTQAKALQFGSRMQEANEIFDALEKDGKLFSTPGANNPITGGIVNQLNTPAGQQLDQAKRNFVNAVLRRESGAAIAPSEFDSADKQYFPQPGDSDEVVKQKRGNRELSMRGILAEVPDADTRIAKIRTPLAPAANAQAAARPTPGKSEGGWTFTGGDPGDRRNWRKT